MIYEWKYKEFKAIGQKLKQKIMKLHKHLSFFTPFLRG